MLSIRSEILDMPRQKGENRIQAFCDNITGSGDQKFVKKCQNLLTLMYVHASVACDHCEQRILKNKQLSVFLHLLSRILENNMTLAESYHTHRDSVNFTYIYAYTHFSLSLSHSLLSLALALSLSLTDIVNVEPTVFAPNWTRSVPVNGGPAARPNC